MRELSLLTPLAAVAVCEAIQAVCEIAPSIKWVNDILIQNKKVCGILTETCGLSSEGYPALCIVGIGLNLRFDAAAHPELAEIAGSIADVAETLPTRAQLTAAILNHFEPWYDALLHGETQPLLQAYRDRLVCLGKEITVHTGTGSLSRPLHRFDRRRKFGRTESAGTHTHFASWRNLYPFNRCKYLSTEKGFLTIRWTGIPLLSFISFLYFHNNRQNHRAALCLLKEIVAQRTLECTFDSIPIPYPFILTVVQRHL